MPSPKSQRDRLVSQPWERYLNLSGPVVFTIKAAFIDMTQKTID